MPRKSVSTDGRIGILPHDAQPRFDCIARRIICPTLLDNGVCGDILREMTIEYSHCILCRHLISEKIRYCVSIGLAWLAYRNVVFVGRRPSSFTRELRWGKTTARTWCISVRVVITGTVLSLRKVVACRFRFEVKKRGQERKPQLGEEKKRHKINQTGR